MFYGVLVARNIPISILTYSFSEKLVRGQVILVPIGKKLEYGVVFQEISEDRVANINSIKPISKILPYKFSKKQFDFLQLFSLNTLNSLNTSFSQFTSSLRHLTKKNWQILESSNNIANNLDNTDKPLFNQQKPSIEFLLDTDITVRIMYIIRSMLYKTEKQANILILFPEAKSLNNYKEKILKEISEMEKSNELNNKNFNLLTYSGVGKESKYTLRFLMECLSKKKESSNKSQEENSNQNINLILGLRSSIFLPFKDLDQIILVDEANSFYIQDQNSVYYDARDAVFLMSNAYSVNLTFLSTLPSIRLYNFYSKESLDNILSSYTEKDLKPLKTKITSFDKKSANNELYSSQIYDYLDLKLKGDEEFGIFE